MPKMGVVLQDSGVLSAYEYGAVTRLVELGWQPSRCYGSVDRRDHRQLPIAGAYNGDVNANLKRLGMRSHSHRRRSGLPNGRDILDVWKSAPRHGVECSMSAFGRLRSLIPGLGVKFLTMLL
jgi:hypothetical protein